MPSALVVFAIAIGDRVAGDAERLFHAHADASGSVTHRYYTSVFVAERVNRPS
jgi:hypothetical protein